jgi:hypothetical protein
MRWLLRLGTDAPDMDEGRRLTKRADVIAHAGESPVRAGQRTPGIGEELPHGSGREHDVGLLILDLLSHLPEAGIAPDVDGKQKDDNG